VLTTITFYNVSSNCGAVIFLGLNSYHPKLIWSTACTAFHTLNTTRSVKNYII